MQALITEAPRLTALRKETDRLKQILTLELKKAHKLGQRDDVLSRRTPVETHAPMPEVTLRIATPRTLLAAVINTCPAAENLVRIDVVEGKGKQYGKELFVIYYRKDKAEEAAKVIGEAVDACIPQWKIHAEQKGLFLQCEGPALLASVLAYITQGSFDVTILDETYALRMKATASAGRVICRREIHLTKQPVPENAKLILMSALLRDTGSTIDYADALCKTLVHYCQTLIITKDPGNTVLDELRIAAFELVSVCTQNQHQPGVGLQKIKEKFSALQQKYPDIKTNPTKYFDFDSINAVYITYSIAEKLNRYACQPEIPVFAYEKESFAPVKREIVLLGLAFGQNKDDLPRALSESADALNGLIAFFHNPDIAVKAKEDLATILHETKMELYTNVFRHFPATEFVNDKNFEPRLRQHLEFITQVQQYSIHRVLEFQAKNCRFFILGIFLQYYRYVEDWALLNNFAHEYFRSLKEAPEDLYDKMAKTLLPHVMKSDIALVQGDLFMALEQFRLFGDRCFKYIEEKNMAARKYFYHLAQLGKQIIGAFGMLSEYREALTYCVALKNRLANFTNHDEKTLAQIEAFRHACDVLEDMHRHNLYEAANAVQDEALPFKHADLCFTAENAENLQHFKRAFNYQDIAYHETETTLTVKFATKISQRQLQKALRLTLTLKQKQDAYLAEKAEKIAAAAKSSENKVPSPEIERKAPLRKSPKPSTVEKASGRRSPTVVPVAAPPAPRELLKVKFGETFGTYKERLGTKQKITALQGHGNGGQQYPFGLFFGYIDCPYANKRYQKVLKRGQIVGPKGETGIKFFKINNEDAYKIKIVGQNEFLVGHVVKTVDGHHLIRFSELQTHQKEKRAQKK